MFKNFSPKNVPCIQKLWKNTIEPDRPQMTIWRMRAACSIPNATNIHSEYVILIAVPQQQWWHERASILRYTYIAYLVHLAQETSNKTFRNFRLPAILMNDAPNVLFRIKQILIKLDGADFH